MKLRTFLLSLATLAGLGAAPLAAQGHGAQPAHGDTTAAGAAAVNAEVNRSLTGSPQGDHGAAPAGEHGAPAGGDIIMPHITDAPHLEVPWPNSHWAKEVHLPHWAPVQIGGFALDLSPTKHVVMMIVAAVLCAATLITAAAAHKPAQPSSNCVSAASL